jgi:hypothetical protein
MSVLASTNAGMCALWDSSRFTDVTDLDPWEDLLGEDESLVTLIAEGALVPLNVGGSDSFQIAVRTEALTAREQRARIATSQPYLLKDRWTDAAGWLRADRLVRGWHD